MTWTAEWRTKGHFTDSVLVLDDGGVVREAHEASQSVLSRFLTQMGDIRTWMGDSRIGDEDRDPETWGQLVIARGGSGEVLEVEPELLWQGIYLWFRSRGVDYDAPQFKDNSDWSDAPILRRSSPMDD